MEDNKLNKTGTSSNADSVKNMDEQSGKPGDGSQAYIDTDTDAAIAKPGENGKEKKDHPREEKK